MKIQVAVFATLLVCLSAATHLTEQVIAEELLKNMGFEEKPNMKKVCCFTFKNLRAKIQKIKWCNGFVFAYSAISWAKIFVAIFLYLTLAD